MALKDADDGRRFVVESSGPGGGFVSAPMQVQAARALATDAVEEGSRYVRLRNVRTGKRFRWWPELGARRTA